MALQLQMEETPADMEGNGEYVEKVVADNRDCVVFQFGCWAKGKLGKMIRIC